MPMGALSQSTLRASVFECLTRGTIFLLNRLDFRKPTIRDTRTTTTT